MTSAVSKRGAKPARIARLVAVAVALSTLPAGAQSNPREKAAAEALFQQAAELVQQGRHTEACAKFEGSQQLDPALGTMLRLADCYDRIGRTASAWALFQEAAALAKTAGQAEREQIALQRASDLALRLSKVTLEVPPNAQLPGLQIRLGGIAVPSASWNAPLPVDPGPQRLEVSAPDHRPWSTSVEVLAGPSSRSVLVPRLESSPMSIAPADATASSTAAPPATELSAQPVPRSNTGATQRTIGYITGGLGVAGLLAGGVLAYRAYDVNEQSLDQCRREDANACTPNGVQLREEAQDFGTASTVSLVIGGALVAAGVTLVLAAPKERQYASHSLVLRSAVSDRGAQFALGGAF